jgi:hypothetical protein
MNPRKVNGQMIAALDADGPVVSSEQGALDLMGEAYGVDFDWLLVPKSRLAPEFFLLRTGLAGAVLQKFTNYKLQVVILGDISDELAASTALRDFVYECNSGGNIRFASNEEQLPELI